MKRSKRLMGGPLLRRVLTLAAALLLSAAVIAPAPVSALGLDDHEIGFERIVNARDFGGYITSDGRVVKRGVLLRTSELSYASAGDIARLKDQYRLGMIFDFRYGTDHKYCKDKEVPGAVNYNISVKSNKHPSKSGPKKRFKKLKKKSNRALRKSIIYSATKAGRSYTSSLVNSSYSKKQYKKYFDRLLSNTDGRGVIIHCKYGKDRTGVAAFMTLVALGVDEETAYKEYALTNAYAKKYYPKKYSKGRLGVREKDLRYAVKKAKKKYGSLNNFLYNAYGLDADDLARLRAIYTEAPAAANPEPAPAPEAPAADAA